MDKLFVCVLLVLSLFACQAEDEKISLAGEWRTAKDGQVLYLQAKSGRVDSSVVRKGKFEFVLVDTVPDEYILWRVNNGKKAWLRVYLDHCQTHLKLSNETEKLQGADFMKCEITGNPVGAITWDLVRSSLMENDLFRDSVFLQRLREVVERGDMASAYAFMKFGAILADYMTYDEVMGYWNRLPETIKQGVVGKRGKNQLDKYLPFSKGGTLPDFTLNTANGQPVTLSEFVKGKKAVLIVFWASWVPSCPPRNLEVLTLYNKFHEKGLDILGISLDTKKDAWLKSVKENKLPWTQVSDPNMWDAEIAKLYMVNSVPSFILVGEDGKVLANSTQLYRELGKVIENVFK